MTDNGEVVADTADVENNKGTIYATKTDSAFDQTEKFQFYVGSGTTLSGGSVIFGLVIDNVYAPKATAGFKVTDTQPDDVGALDDNNSINTKNTAGKDDYVHNEGILSGNSNAKSE